ncbi:bifunctional DNA-formamidopyrimidine glycosylase/DNA-(apurinic or apyrimidinic site) lyase [Paraglaciecola chathamensis]|jgi:formamidopyrimidine-DNA glycosylase|uniref:bifunctional DNA-formamidopyrimidine glycosylase/DNA-(apurinic or apyrimidinic site) lyase n=1 Tax=Paraglaciecola chathamensis TaxID=368405 RepID=UPI00270F3637|nr:bifunctional DNA-formamidopyrimidine glycosylase/DNA-(apurinic or apyrimidinic site) lyase [Paraglaciecola chathamensis]MDO6841455.1 bifunctional DNA-formamidopyrimidine glycosylase/DNA-(apurinic or apyrimidinic site) lyase [Paraglaciecola chathamensis]
MPELPEVEVSRLGISPHLIGQQIKQVVVRHKQLRWLVPDEVHLAEGLRVNDVRRRAKYLFIDTDAGSIILHLGMSGKLRIVNSDTPVIKHDHLDVVLTNGVCLRFNDARRFGACLWQDVSEPEIGMIAALGPEPLTADFDGQRLYDLSRTKSVAVKNFIMDNKVVVGVGNIYANEALFIAGIDPRKAAKKVSKKTYLTLGDIIKEVLAKAIEQGGTTLKDFTQADGNPGYFAQHLRVYGRKGEACEVCASEIQSVTLGQRNTFFCEQCQT